jgi:hypothetical protein
MDTASAQRRKPVNPLWDVRSRDPEPEPEVDLVRRAEVETTLARADEALSAALPETPSPRQERRFLPAGTPRRAPAENQTEISPTSAEKADGKAFPGALTGALEQQARRLLNADATIKITIDTEPGPAVITYEFDRPVTSAEGIQGQLYVIYEPEHKVPFQEGRGAERVVQVVQAEDFAQRLPPDTQTLRLRIEGQTATWSRPDSDSNE